jgi:alanyl-tRNA synthetase
MAAGGSGGGRPDSAMAGFKELDKVSACFDAAKAFIENLK